MKQSSEKLVIILALISYCMTYCKNQQKEESMQPYEGYYVRSSKGEAMEALKNHCIDTIQFNKGEIIADIGGSYGGCEAMLSLFNDSLTFYIQDIDTVVCNQKAIDKVVADYEEVNKKPFTNKFIAVNGSDTETNLPDDSFDKILMLWTYPSLKQPYDFILNVKQKLKKEGVFYVINPALDEEHGKELTAKYGWNASPVEREINDIIKCGFELIRIYRNYKAPEQPYVMVFKKKNLSN